ncbi:MAG TPA: sulfatase-like hydrolase/transferase [Methylomirabilota bacterium]|nr:sulfatase-like hydrolase/transferase [Methylomirabilota bacterium]
MATFRVLDGRRAWKTACLLFACIGLLARAAETAPNIIVVLADDLGIGDVGSYGGKVPTPHLDGMARDGTRFTQFYVASPICSPSRAALITGQFPARHRITSYLQTRRGNRACEQADFLATNAPALPRVLKAAGYATAHIGKWHLGGGRDVTNAPPFSAYGYDVGFGTYESPEPHPELTATNWIWSPRDKVPRWERTRWMVDRTLEFLRTHPGQPCFVNLWLDDVHTPWVPSRDVQDDRALRGDTRANLRPVLTEMDRELGRLLATLRRDGIASNTLVLFLGDNGPLPTFRQERTAGLRGSKLSLYEGGIREPLIAWWPGRVPAGRVDTNTVLSAVDFFPTLVRLARGTMARDAQTDGEDVSAALFGKALVRTRPLFWEYGRNTNAFAFPGIAQNRSPNVAVRDGHWKLLIQADGTGAELYEILRDPNETQNVSDAYRDVARRLAKAALDWRTSLPSRP